MLGGNLLNIFFNSVIIGYLIMCLYFGFLSASRIANLREFALGYKKISTAILIATMYATHLGAGSSLGLMEQIGNIGLIGIIMTFGDVSRWLVTRTIFSRNVGRFKGCLSMSDVMAQLYGPFGLKISNIVNVIASVGIVSIQTVVIGFLLQYFFGVSQTFGIVLGALVLTFYSASGGVKAVILTDLMQAILFMIVIFAVFILSAQEIMTRHDFWQSIPASKAWVIPYDWHTALIVLGMVVYSLMPMACPPFVQRILISGSDKQLYKCFTYAALIDCVVMAALTVIAILLLSTTQEGTLTKTGIFEIIATHLHPMLIAAVIVGLMAVTMSTADSWLNASAVIITRSVICHKRNFTDSQQVLIARLTTLGLGMVAATFAIIGDSVLSLLLITECFLEPLLLVPISAGFLGYNCTPADYKRSVAIAMAGVFIGGVIEGELAFISLLFGLIGSTIGLAWSKKWTLFTPDGSPIISMPKYREITPRFFSLVLTFSVMISLAHLYLNPEWLICELGIIMSGTIAILALTLYMYGTGYINTRRISAQTSTIFLIASVSSIAFRNLHPIMLTLLLITGFSMIIHRQQLPTIAGLLIGSLSCNIATISFYAPPVTLLAIIAGASGMMLIALILMYLDAREYYHDADARLQYTAKELSDKGTELAELSHALAATAQNLIYTMQQLSSTQSELANASSQLTTSNENLAITESKLGVTKKELNNTTRRLRVTKDKLLHTKNELLKTKSKFSWLGSCLSSTNGELLAVREHLESTETRLDTAYEQLENTEDELARSKRKLAKTEKKLAEAKKRLTEHQAIPLHHTSASSH